MSTKTWTFALRRSGGHGASVQAKKMYQFSENPVAEFYGRQFFSISDEAGNVVAYSEKVFEIPKEVRLLGEGQTLIFEKAVIRGGVIWGGEIWGGEIWGGEILGGVIRGGEIRGGVIRGGVIRGGVYEYTLLQIQGSRHYCYATPTDSGGIELGIGCHIYQISEWQEKYQQIGENESYSGEEIAEYAEYIALFAARYGEK